MDNKFWEFKAKKDTKEGELLLYGTISNRTWWGDETTPKQFKKDLDDLGDIDVLNIYINSPGGDVFAGQTIYSMLKRHKATKNVHIDGLAASAASLVAMAGDNVIMPKNAMMMIHKAWIIAVGNADDMRKMADDLDKIDESIVSAYEMKTELPRDEILQIMENETWLTAEEAVEKGFADKVEEEKKVAASIDGDFLILNNQRFDLRNCKNVPKFDLKQEFDLKQDRADNPEPVANKDNLAEQKKDFTRIRNKILSIN